MTFEEQFRDAIKVPYPQLNFEKIEHLIAQYYEALELPMFKDIVYCYDSTHWTTRTKNYISLAYFARSSRYWKHPIGLYHNNVTQIRSFTNEKQYSPVSVFNPLVHFTDSSINVLTIKYRLPKVEKLQLELLRAGVLDFSPLEYVNVWLKPKALSFNENGALHNPEGAAVHWHSDLKHYFFNGVSVSRRFIEEPPTVGYINRQRNAERKRILIERFGYEEYIKAVRARLLDEHKKYGKLWQVDQGALWVAPNIRWTSQWSNNRVRAEQSTDRYLHLLEVINSTSEPDGTFKRYFLRVPPTIVKAKTAAAWTFGETRDNYAPMIET